MSRRPLRFRQSDLMRAMRAAQRMGGAWGVDILMDGTIRVVPAQPVQIGNPLPSGPIEEGDNPWDS